MIPRPLAAQGTAESPLRAAVEHTLAFLAFAALTMLYMRPAALVLATHLAPDPGDPLFNLVVLKWGIRQWHLGLADFWNLPFFFPARQVTTFSDHLLGPSALATLFTAVVPNALAAYNVMFLGSFVLCGWSTWYVLRRMGLGLPTAFLGGCMFAFAPFRWDQMSHVQILLMHWIPLTLWTWDRLLAAPGWRRALAFLPFYVLHLTGGTYLAYMIHIPMAIQLACRAPGLWRGKRVQALRVLVPVGLACAILLLAIFRPYLAASHQQKRNRAEIQIYSASLVSYLTPGDHNLYSVLWPDALHRPENVLFPGIAVSALAIAAAWHFRRARSAASTVFAALTRRRQLVLLFLGALAAAAWIGGELRTWILSGPAKVNALVLVALALAVGLPALALAGRRWRNLVLPAAAAALIVAAILAVARWRHVPLAAFSTYRLGMTAICAGLVAWFLWTRWTPGVARFLPSLDPWRRGLLISGVACFLLSFPMIYLPMMNYLPGLSGMRVPARFLPFVLFPLVVLAAGELDRRWRAARPERRRAFGMIAAALVLLEVAPRPINWEPLPSEAELAPVYHWLARQPAVDGVLELPISDDTTDISYMYAATLHWKPLVNGYSGGEPPDYELLDTSLQDIATRPDRAWQALLDSGATHVVVHETMFVRDEGPSLTAWITKRGGREVARFGGDSVVELPR